MVTHDTECSYWAQAFGVAPLPPPTFFNSPPTAKLDETPAGVIEKYKKQINRPSGLASACLPVCAHAELHRKITVTI